MKKVFALIFALMMLCCSAVALAEEKVDIDIDGLVTVSITLPEGYEAGTYAESGSLAAVIIPADGDENKVGFILLIAPDEEYADLERLNDLDDEALAAYEQSFIEDLFAPTVTHTETEHGTKLFIIDENDSEYDMVEIATLYKGYNMVIYLDYSDGRTVTEADIAAGVKIFSNLALIWPETVA